MVYSKNIPKLVKSGRKKRGGSREYWEIEGGKEK